MISIDAGEGSFDLPVPSLAGALIIKARAAANARRTRAKHERDLARLLALVAEPRAMRAELSRKERGYLGLHPALLSTTHPAWRGIPAAEDAVLALGILVK